MTIGHGLRPAREEDPIQPESRLEARFPEVTYGPLSRDCGRDTNVSR